MKIAVIRKDKLENTVFCNALNDLNLSYVDVNHPKNIELNLLDSDLAQPICFLNNVPLINIEKIFFLGYPSSINNNFPSTDEIFLIQERTQSFLACLYALEKSKIINHGFVFRWNKTILNESSYKRYFSKQGINVTTDYIDNETVYKNQVDNSEKYVIVTRKRFEVYENKVTEKIFKLGLLFLIEFEIDWCVIFYKQREEIEISKVVVDFYLLDYHLTKQILLTIL